MSEQTAERLRVAEVATNEGYDNSMELLEAYGMESVVPACCSEGCQVEPDGRCPHGHPSILLAMGVI